MSAHGYQGDAPQRSAPPRQARPSTSPRAQGRLPEHRAAVRSAPTAADRRALCRRRASPSPARQQPGRGPLLARRAAGRLARALVCMPCQIRTVGCVGSPKRSASRPGAVLDGLHTAEATASRRHPNGSTRPTYHRLYHRRMPGEDNDLSSRFDYLFEPLDERGVGRRRRRRRISGERSADDETPSRSAAPVRLALRGLRPGYAGSRGSGRHAAAATAERRPSTAPLDPAPLSTTEPDAIPPAGPVPPWQPRRRCRPRRRRPSSRAPRSRRRLSRSAPTAPRREPEVHVTNSPTTRAPISVAPETRQPFPNQGPRGGGRPEDGGGILGGFPDRTCPARCDARPRDL